MGRSVARWTDGDDIRRAAGSGWMTEAQDREWWHNMKEACAQQWTDNGYKDVFEYNVDDEGEFFAQKWHFLGNV